MVFRKLMATFCLFLALVAPEARAGDSDNLANEQVRLNQQILQELKELNKNSQYQAAQGEYLNHQIEALGSVGIGALLVGAAGEAKSGLGVALGLVGLSSVVGGILAFTFTSRPAKAASETDLYFERPDLFLKNNSDQRALAVLKENPKLRERFENYVAAIKSASDQKAKPSTTSPGAEELSSYNPQAVIGI